jgi:hypothetical protein
VNGLAEGWWLKIKQKNERENKETLEKILRPERHQIFVHLVDKEKKSL